MKRRRKKKKGGISRLWASLKEATWPEIGSLKIFILILCCVVTVWAGCAWYLIEHYYEASPVSAGQFGDTFGPINSLFAGLAFAGLLYTILLQRKELRETREEFKQQNLTLRLQRFENTLFNLLTARNSVISGLKGNYLNFQNQRVNYNGRELLHYVNIEIRERVKSFDLSNEKNVSEQDIAQLRKLYNLAVTHFANPLELYLSNLNTILKFIRKSDLLGNDTEREFYFSIVRGQLSFEERRFLFYYMSIADRKTLSGNFIGSMRNTEIEFRFNQYSSEFLFHPSHNKLQDSWDGFLNYYDDVEYDEDFDD